MWLLKVRCIEGELPAYCVSLRETGDVCGKCVQEKVRCEALWLCARVQGFWGKGRLSWDERTSEKSGHELLSISLLSAMCRNQAGIQPTFQMV